MYLQVSVIHSVHRGGVCGCSGGGVHGFIWGACVVLFGGVRGFIRGACMVLFGGVCGFIRGACVVLFRGACMVLFRGGMHGFIGGHAWFYLGGCVALLGGRAWFYSGGVCMVLFGGACVVFSVFSDTMRYGQWAGGTHPTGMHFCWKIFVIFCYCQKPDGFVVSHLSNVGHNFDSTVFRGFYFGLYWLRCLIVFRDNNWNDICYTL